jgi:hypothetical protein
MRSGRWRTSRKGCWSTCRATSCAASASCWAVRRARCGSRPASSRWRARWPTAAWRRRHLQPARPLAANRWRMGGQAGRWRRLPRHPPVQRPRGGAGVDPRQRGGGYVLQPFIAGKLGSLSLMCCDGVARVLSLQPGAGGHARQPLPFPRQHRQRPGRRRRRARPPGQQVAAAIPSLWGYVGVDFVLTAHGAVVLDVNPRLTAAYAGLHASTGRNPAGLVIDLLKGRPPCRPRSARRAVSVDLAAP